jgi:hypothetical protein
MSHGPRWLAGPPRSKDHGGLGLAGPAPFGCSGRRELAVMKGKGRGEQRGSHQGLQRPGSMRSEASGRENNQWRLLQDNEPNGAGRG